MYYFLNIVINEYNIKIYILFYALIKTYIGIFFS